MKNKLSRPPWIIGKVSLNEQSSTTFRIDSRIQDIHIAEVYGEGKEDDTNAAAIVSAVNNTYGAGINPAAVPEMLEALKKVMAYFDDDHLYTDSPTPKAVFAAIEKAKLPS